MTKWWLGLFVVLAAACGFPRPADLTSDGGGGGDDQPTGCTRDEDCGRSTPFCVDTVCAVCKASDSCPAARPVCDLTSHDCRTCVKDSECDSGACDYAAGTCVEQGKILYASAAGTTAEPCTRTQPCSFTQAVASLDAAHVYIVMAPGIYAAPVFFFSENATVCGSGATFDAQSFYMNTSGSLWLRNVKMRLSTAQTNVFGTRSDVIAVARNGDLILEDADLETMKPFAVDGGKSIIIRNSIISHGLVSADGALVVDRSTFLSGAGIQTTSNAQPLTILNSVFISSSGTNVLTLNTVGDAGSIATMYIANNTFSNGGISCNGSTGIMGSKFFEANIFYNVDKLAMRNDCYYSHNLILPVMDVVGADNVAVDPMFVDAGHNDLHLKMGSPAIDAADPNPLHPNGHDRDGNPRPRGNRFDLGAYESAP